MGSSLFHHIGNLLSVYLSLAISPFKLEEVEDDEEAEADPCLLPSAEIHSSSSVAELSTLASEFAEWQEKDSGRYSKFKLCVASPYLLPHGSELHDRARPHTPVRDDRAPKYVNRDRSASPLNWSLRCGFKYNRLSLYSQYSQSSPHQVVQIQGESTSCPCYRSSLCF